MKAFLQKLKYEAIRNAEASEFNIVGLGWIGSIGFPLYYYIWTYVFPQQYESFPLRMLAGAVCVPLIFYPYMGDIFKKYMPIYWYATLFYLFPFLAAFLFLKNNGSPVWLVCEAIMIFLVILFVIDWLIIIAYLIVGTILGALCYWYTTENPSIPWELLLEQTPLFLFALLGGSLFNISHKRGVALQEKLEGILSIGGNIAHELRTPLLSIKSAVIGFKKYFPDIVKGYKLADEAGLDVPHFYKSDFEVLEEMADSISEEVDYANATIKMVLISANKEKINERDFKSYSIKETFLESVERYPFQYDDDRNKIHCNIEHDFDYFGSNLLMSSVFFNLIRNAIFFINKAKKGGIFVWTEIDSNKNIFHFKDTGFGISSSNLHHVFERFYTTTSEGTGLGLNFCYQVIRQFGGKIECFSEYGEYTDFVISFNKINKLNEED